METTETKTKTKTSSEPPPRKKSDPNFPITKKSIDWNNPDLIIEDDDGDPG